MEKCVLCKKKTIYLFQCKCTGIFCQKHKQPEDHECKFDFLTDYRKKLEKENIQVISPKIIQF